MRFPYAATLRWLFPSRLSPVNRNIFYFTVDTALQGMMNGGIFSFLSVFIVRLGASNLMVSLLAALPSIVTALSSIPAARWVERQRDMIRFVNFARLFFRGSFLVIALLPFFVHEHLVEVIVVVWAVKSVFGAVVDMAWMTAAAEMLPPERRARVNGARWAILSLVTAGSTAVFGYLLDRLPSPLSYQLVFLISFIGSTAGMFFYAKIRIPDNVPVVHTPGARQSLWQRARAYGQMVAVPAFWRYECTAIVLRFGLNLPSALYSIYWIRQLDTSDLWIGWQATIGKLALILGYFTWGRHISRKGHHRALLICTTCLGLYPVLTGLIPDPTWLLPVAIVQGFFVTGIDISFFDTLLTVTPAARRPSFVALDSLLANLTIFLAPLVGSLLADRWDFRTVFFIAGGIHLLAAGLFWKLRVTESEAKN